MFGSYVKKSVAGSLFFVCVVLSGVSHADDVIDSINEGLQYYKAGKYKDAVESLNYASQIIQQKKGKGLESFLPEPLQGWTAEAASSQAVPVYGGGITVERQYTKGSSTISISIITDSPMMQGVMMMFSNPMIASASGGQLAKIKRQKAIINFDAANRQGTIQIVVANRYLITVDGDGVSKEDLKAYAESIDFAGLKSLE